MNEDVYERIVKTLSWRKIVSFNVIVFLVLIVPISLRMAQTSTENRSSAAEEAPIVIPPPDYPTFPPKIERVNTFFGKKGDTVVILGANFGQYQWGSKVYVGASEALKDSIVRWSNNIIEVKIPDSARTGAVWVSINNQEARWEGSLLLYDVARAAQIGLKKINSNQGSFYITNAQGTVKGMVELSLVSEPFTMTAADPTTTISSQVLRTDSLGKKLTVNFEMATPLSSTKTEIANYSYPGLGNVEIIRAELYDASGKLIPVFSDPLSIRVTP